MEICYVPVAKLKDVQEMMSNWKRNNKLIRYWCFASIAISFMNLYYLNFSESQGDVALAITACMLSDFIMAMLALLVNRSQKIIYYLSFVGAMLFSFSASFIGFEAITLPAAMALSVPFFVKAIFPFVCSFYIIMVLICIDVKSFVFCRGCISPFVRKRALCLFRQRIQTFRLESDA